MADESKLDILNAVFSIDKADELQRLPLEHDRLFDEAQEIPDDDGPLSLIDSRDQLEVRPEFRNVVFYVDHGDRKEVLYFI